MKLVILSKKYLALILVATILFPVFSEPGWLASTVHASVIEKDLSDDTDELQELNEIQNEELNESVNQNDINDTENSDNTTIGSDEENDLFIPENPSEMEEVEEEDSKVLESMPEEEAMAHEALLISPFTLREITYSSIAPAGFYANGRSLVFRADGTNPSYTNVYYNDDPANTAPINLTNYYPGITGNTTTGFNLNASAACTFYLGCYQEDYIGDTQAIIESGTLYRIFGGGGSATGSANVTGDVYININGGIVTRIYGGGYAQGANSEAKVIGSTNITITGGTINNTAAPTGGTNFAGGGYAQGNPSNASITQNTNILIDAPNDNISTNSAKIHAGGFAVNSGSVADVNNANITIKSWTSSSGLTVYGGGHGMGISTVARVQNTATVFIGEGVTGAGSFYVYGGGYAYNTNAVTSVSNTSVTVSAKNSSGTTRIYGGGYAYASGQNVSVQNAEVTITDNAELGTSYIHGGGYSYDINNARVENSIVTVEDGAVIGGNSFIYGGGGTGSFTGAIAEVGTVIINYHATARSSSGFNGIIVGGGASTNPSYPTPVEHSFINFDGGIWRIYTGSGNTNTTSSVTKTSTLNITGGTVDDFISDDKNLAPDKKIFISGGAINGRVVSGNSRYKGFDPDGTGDNAISNTNRQVTPADARMTYKVSLTLANDSGTPTDNAAVDSLDLTLNGQDYIYGIENMYVGLNGALTLMVPEGVQIKGVTVNGNYYSATADIISAIDNTAEGTLFYGSVNPVTDIVWTPPTGVAATPELAFGSASEGKGGALSGTVVSPATATFQSITWSVKSFQSPTGTAWISGGRLYATRSGTATVTATVKNGLGMGGDFKKDFDITFTAPPPPIPVMDITNIPSVLEIGESLTLLGMVTPSNATNKIILWSIKDRGTTDASVTGKTLTASISGTITVTATIKDGKNWDVDYTQDFTIIVTPKRTTLIDDPSGLSVTGVIDEGVATLMVIDIEQAELSDYSGLDYAIDSGEEYIAAYDVSLEGTLYSGPITIKLPVPAEYNGRIITIVYIGGMPILPGLQAALPVIKNIEVVNGTVALTVMVTTPSASLGQFAMSAEPPPAGRQWIVTVPSNPVGTNGLKEAIKAANDNGSMVTEPFVITLGADIIYDDFNLGSLSYTGTSYLIIKSDDTRRTLTFTSSQENNGNTLSVSRGDLIFQNLNLVLANKDKRAYPGTLRSSIYVISGNLIIDNCDVKGHADSIYTQAIYNSNADSTITFTNSKFHGFENSSVLTAFDSSVTVIGCEFKDIGNGALNLSYNRAFIDDSIFENCKSSNGGGLYAYGMLSLNMQNSTFKGCEAKDRGGAIHITDNSGINADTIKYLNNVTIENCKTITGNTGSDINLGITGGGYGGGGLYIGGRQQVVMSSGKITGCQVDNDSGFGGGVFININAGLTVNRTVISGNSAARGGGLLVHSYSGSDTVYLILNGAKIHDNTANPSATSVTFGGGGGIHVGRHASLTVEDLTEIYKNTARRGGAICFEDVGGSADKSYLTINSAYIHDNEAKYTGSYPAGNGLGGGIYIGTHNVGYFGSTLITDNTANKGGGIWACPTGNVHIFPIDGAAIYKNSAVDQGDDLHAERGAFSVVSSYALGGGDANWYMDTAGSRDSAKADETYFNGSQNMGFSLKSHLSDGDIVDALNASPAVLITDNKAAAGGGIAVNCDAVIGSDGLPPARVRLIKKDVDTDAVLKGAVFQLYEKNGNKPVGPQRMTDEKGEITVNNLQDGILYYFMELTPPPGYKIEGSGRYEFTGCAGTTEVIQSFNKNLNLFLAITKKISDYDTKGQTYNAANDNKKFEFTVEIGNVPGETYTYQINGGPLLTLQSGGKIDLGHNDRAVFNNLPVGTPYRVTEEPYYIPDADSYVSFGSNENGAVLQDGSEVYFNNVFSPANSLPPGELSSLVVVDRILAPPEDIDYNKYFEVMVAIGNDLGKQYYYQVVTLAELDYYDANDPLLTSPPGRSSNSVEHGYLPGIPVQMSSSNEIRVQLNHSAAIIIYGIPVGTSYRITQVDYTYIDGYMIDSTVKTTGIILPDKDTLTDHDTADTHLFRIRADIFNYYVLPVVHTFEIQKKWNHGTNFNPPQKAEIRLVNTLTGAYDSRTLNPFNNWIDSFTALKYDAVTGRTIQYRLEEVSVAGYTPSLKPVSGQSALSNNSTWVLTNTYRDDNMLSDLSITPTVSPISMSKDNMGSNVPQTGDDNNMTLWIIALLVSILGMLSVLVWEKRRKSKRK